MPDQPAQRQDAIFVGGELRRPAGGELRRPAGGAAVGVRDPAVAVAKAEQSGLGGRSGGDSNIEEFIERRWLTVNPGPAHYPY